MNVVSQMARPTPIAKTPRTSHGQATLTPEDNRGRLLFLVKVETAYARAQALTPLHPPW